MKVKIGKYVSWFGPYQLAEFLCFWAKRVPDEYGINRKPEWVHHFGDWLAYGHVIPEAEVGSITFLDEDRNTTRLYKFLIWLDKFKKRKMQIHIDPWDTWGMDDTLAHIILPMLKQLNETKHGAPHVADDDVPEDIRSTNAPPKANDYDIDDNHFKRWDWVLGEMIFAFENKLDDSWADQFSTGTSSLAFKKLENGNSEMVRTKKDTRKIDWDGRNAYQARISNGFRLFGKYYESLWT